MEVSESKIVELLFSDFLNLLPEAKDNNELLEKNFIIIGEVEEIGSKIVKLRDPFDEAESPLFLIANDANLIERIRSEKSSTIRAVIKMEREEDTLNLVLVSYTPIKEFANLKNYYRAIIRSEYKLNTSLRNDI